MTYVLQRTKVLCGTLTGFASGLRDLGESPTNHASTKTITAFHSLLQPSMAGSSDMFQS
jgi:hypothetical protein